VFQWAQARLSSRAEFSPGFSPNLRAREIRFADVDILRVVEKVDLHSMQGGSSALMNTEQRILFGVHDFDSAKEALATTGDLLRDRENIQLTLFHGVLDQDLSSLSRLLRMTPEAVEEYHKICNLEEQQVLVQAKQSLADSGFDTNKVQTVCEGKCRDPAAAILTLANSENLDPIILARRREPLLERLLLGPVTYRLVQMAEWRTVWLIDPPVSSHNVLITLVGAPISRRVMEYTVRNFAHLKESKFTFLHVIPPMPPSYWDDTRIFEGLERKERDAKKTQWMQEYADRVKEFAEEGKRQLIDAGVPPEQVSFKVLSTKKGMAGDILVELEQGNYGILVLGRKGSKEISPFRLGSIANKLLHNAQRCVVCLVN